MLVFKLLYEYTFFYCYLFTRLSVCVCIYLSACLSVPICLSVINFFCTGLVVCLSVCIFFCFRLLVYLSVSLSLSAYLSICLSLKHTHTPTHLLQLLPLLVAHSWRQHKEELLEEAESIPGDAGGTEDGDHIPLQVVAACCYGIILILDD